ncbi:putative cytochrome p450 [Phaeomoniella chlamydospora]|uniref:Putative cytochrome p450 n=1 Tax=Phaeomoniella chlamydospora TaxID=158046 RepID=A0A0G2ENI8_PHACM|nr:putative cytochrome p450 [Phaeomoniella chlamydospora]
MSKLGPPGEPFFGHFRVVPYSNPQFRYIEWGKEYNSDVLFFNVFGKPVVVLNSVEAAEELLEKKGANFQDRPRFVMFEVMGWGVTLTFLRNGPRFRLHRKLIQSTFTQSACKTYRTVQTEEMRRAVRDILDRPSKWEMLIRKGTVAIVLRLGFGVRVHDDDDEYIKMADEANYATTQGGTPASTIGDHFPIITYLPNWLARSAPLKHARDWGWAIRKIHETAWNSTMKEIEAGNAEPSFMKTYLERYNQSLATGQPCEHTPIDIQGAAGAIFIAGGNTTWSTIMVCILQLLLNPSVKAKAIAEIDAVIGSSRLPTFEDQDSLPYLNNLIQETFRIAPLSPVGVPHKSIAPDNYKGYYIPAGSIVYANARAMTLDSTVYASPSQFDPDRYTHGEPYPKGHFGFGRRACPGRYLAANSVYIFMATLLATTDFAFPKSEAGLPKARELGLSNGLSSHPESYECIMKPRSEEKRLLVISGTAI